jgi:hypothetical protein
LSDRNVDWDLVDPNARLEWHHVVPQAVREFAEGRGYDIDAFGVMIPRLHHQAHHNAQDPENNILKPVTHWEEQVKLWEAMEDCIGIRTTPEEIHAFGLKLLEEGGLLKKDAQGNTIFADTRWPSGRAKPEFAPGGGPWLKTNNLKKPPRKKRAPKVQRKRAKTGLAKR